ncbi:hypothetical protein TKK_0000745 [Trichogramma kaykai]
MYDYVRILFEICEEQNRPVLVDAQDRYGNTALYVALACGREKLVRLLLSKGADPNLANEKGLTPLHLTRMESHCEEAWTERFIGMCQEVNRPVLIDAPDYRDRTPLQWAVAQHLTGSINALVDHGADLESRPAFPDETFFLRAHLLNQDCNQFKLRLTADLMRCVERLEARGYAMSRADALLVMEFVHQYELLQTARNLRRAWHEDEEFSSSAKEIAIEPDLSLYELVLMAPCTRQLCETMTRKFFKRWAAHSLRGLQRDRLPLECCEMIADELQNLDLRSIVLAAEGRN